MHFGGLCPPRNLSISLLSQGAGLELSVDSPILWQPLSGSPSRQMRPGFPGQPEDPGCTPTSSTKLLMLPQEGAASPARGQPSRALGARMLAPAGLSSCCVWAQGGSSFPPPARAPPWLWDKDSPKWTLPGTCGRDDDLSPSALTLLILNQEGRAPWPWLWAAPWTRDPCGCFSLADEALTQPGR